MGRLDLDALLEHITLEDSDLPVDPEFISNFLGPYFPDLSPADLAAKIAEVIATERSKTGL